MNSTPDSWDDDSPLASGTASPCHSGPPPVPPSAFSDGGGGGPRHMFMMGLNPNAPAFNFNANAPAFVPSFNTPPPGMSPSHQPHNQGPPPFMNMPPMGNMPPMFQQRPPPHLMGGLPVHPHPQMQPQNRHPTSDHNINSSPAHVNGPSPPASTENIPRRNDADSDSGESQPDPVDVNHINCDINGEVPASEATAAASVAAPVTDSSSSSAAVSPTDSVPETPDATNAESPAAKPAAAIAPESWEEEGSGSGAQSENQEDEDEDESIKQARIERKKKEKERKKSEGPKMDHLNVIFIGHVDAGKSTIGGHVMYLTGMVDKRTLEKYEREAKEKNRETWYLSWALDTNQEERDKGKTVEVGRAFFQTDKKHFTILDAPGHKSFVPNMITGTSQADVAVLVISARRGEFETGFERGGQTKEHTMLAKTAGVNKLVVLINKMDDPTVEWDQTRYDEVKDQLTPFLKKCGFNPKKDVQFIPCSGLTGAFLKEPPGPKFCNWYSGPCLLSFLDNLPAVERMGVDKPLRMPIIDRYRDMGTIVMGKIEAGCVEKGQSIQMMPNRALVEVTQIWADEEEASRAEAGDNVKLKLKNIEEEDVCPGFVLCDYRDPCKVGKVFIAQVRILEYKSIICSGFKAIMHINAAAEEVEIKALVSTIDPKTGEKMEKGKVRPRFIKQGMIANVQFEVSAGVICIEAFKDFPQMGRFTLRDEGKTIAMGKVLKVADYKECD